MLKQNKTKKKIISTKIHSISSFYHKIMKICYEFWCNRYIFCVHTQCVCVCVQSCFKTIENENQTESTFLWKKSPVQREEQKTSTNKNSSFLSGRLPSRVYFGSQKIAHVSKVYTVKSTFYICYVSCCSFLSVQHGIKIPGKEFEKCLLLLVFFSFAFIVLICAVIFLHAEYLQSFRVIWSPSGQPFGIYRYLFSLFAIFFLSFAYFCCCCCFVSYGCDGHKFVINSKFWFRFHFTDADMNIPFSSSKLATWILSSLGRGYRFSNVKLKSSIS